MEQWEAALEDHRAGMKYQEIAEKYGVSLSAVKSWASRKWKQQPQKKVATSKRKKSQPSGKKSQPKRRPGAPLGNKNAVGNHGGAPPGNRNNYRHGFFIDTLSDEEQAMIAERGAISEEEHLQNQMNLWEIRERHLMQEIGRQRAVASGLAVRMVHRGEETKMELVSTLENIKHLESLLTTAQRGHIRCIEALHRIHAEARDEDLEKLDALLNEIHLGET